MCPHACRSRNMKRAPCLPPDDLTPCFPKRALPCWQRLFAWANSVGPALIDHWQRLQGWTLASWQGKLRQTEEGFHHALDP